MTRDEQEAGSRQHASRVQILPLSSGGWAIFASQASPQPCWIFASLVEAEGSIREICQQQWDERQERERRQQARTMAGLKEPSQTLSASLEDLGL